MHANATKQHPESDPGTASPPPRTARFVLILSGVVIFGLTLSACSSWGNKETGAVIGTGAGAVIGNQTDSTARGAIIGHQMDQQAKELEEEVPGATVDRVGEGIQLTFASGLLFDFGSPAIRPAAGENLRTVAASLGELEPLATDEREAGRQANRRIELAVHSGEAMAARR